MRTPEQLKGQIRSFAEKRNLQPQEVLQMYLLERVLERLSKSPYKNNFILKGGLLISSMIGITERTTMDMDTTVTGINLEEKELERIIHEILLIDLGDGIEFEFEKLEPIREDDYNNYRAHFVAHYGKIANKMKVDITTGDEITPRAVQYSYRTILDNDEIDVMAYNIETIVAEKYETIIRRNIGTTRARDFYDLYMFYNLYKESINFDILKLAVTRTAKKRKSLQTMSEWEEIIEDMKEEPALKNLWKNYCENNTYAADVRYDKIMEITQHIAAVLGS
ncbi:MAG: nucleotidyl transferase AbiEii/AbiGii toxin family protein [Lachnospiraceae bacterium]|nr:nucleotidyl transferase AbiEii/AbiGii toxin family protein [Lachnospiraceae bacterium]